MSGSQNTCELEIATTCHSLSFLDSAHVGRKPLVLTLGTLTVLERNEVEPDCPRLCGQDMGQVKQARFSQETEPLQVSQRE